MYNLMVKCEFCASHFLPNNYNNKCKNLHGHNWTVEVFLKTRYLDSNGLSIDFIEVKNKLDEILESLDHTNLNDLECFKEIPPSCEYIALYIFNQMLEKKWNIEYEKDIWLTSVRVWESNNSYAEYIGDDNLNLIK